MGGIQNKLQLLNVTEMKTLKLYKPYLRERGFIQRNLLNYERYLSTQIYSQDTKIEMTFEKSQGKNWNSTLYSCQHL